MRFPAIDFFVNSILPRQLAITAAGDRHSPTPAVGIVSGRSTRQSTANPPRRSPLNIPPPAAATLAEALSVEAATSPTPSNEDSSSEVESNEDSESGDEDHGTSFPDSRVSENEEESMDFFGTASGEGDYVIEEFSVQQRVMHFLRERIDNRRNRQNVETCLLVEAGSSVSDERATTSDVRNQMMLERYMNLVRTFQTDDFVSPSVQDEMAMKLFNAKKGITGAHLWKKFEDWRKEIRTLYTPKLPSDLSSIPSGQQLKDVYKKFVLDHYHEENVSSRCYFHLYNQSS
jgi:hypothetical protein